jgi:hypothetical protein
MLSVLKNKNWVFVLCNSVKKLWLPSLKYPLLISNIFANLGSGWNETSQGINILTGQQCCSLLSFCQLVYNFRGNLVFFAQRIAIDYGHISIYNISDGSWSTATLSQSHYALAIISIENNLFLFQVVIPAHVKFLVLNTRSMNSPSFPSRRVLRLVRMWCVHLERKDRTDYFLSEQIRNFFPNSDPLPHESAQMIPFPPFRA